MVRLSEKHGLNAAIPLCFFCNKPKNEILIPGRLPGDVEAPRNAVWNKEPCDECQGWMKQGVILISVRPTEDPKERENPYRTGGWVVIKEEAVREMFTEGPVLDGVLNKRVAFVDDQTWDLLGLPRGDVKPEEPG